MDCPYCAEEIPDGSRVCPICGTRLKAEDGPGPAPEHVVFTHTGQRFLLGYTLDSFGIWDRLAPGPPVQRLPRTDQGWIDAWRIYSAWEPGNAPVVPGEAQPAAVGPSGMPGWAKALIAIAAVLLVVVVLGIPTFLGARIRAQDKAAQSELRNAMAAAKTFFVDGDTYTGFDSVQAGSIEPSLGFQGDVPARVGAVSIDYAIAGVVMSDKSASGKTFCIADDSSTGTVYGSRDGVGQTTIAGCGTAGDWGS